MNIANKTVLITGANRGIGRALVDEALKRGAKRVYAGTRGALPIADPRVTPLTLDVTDASQIQQAAAQVESLDVLINNAGIVLYDDLSNFDIVEQHLAVNLLGPLKVTYAFLPLLRRSQGAIVNNLSLVALAALPIIPSYSISKAAAFNLTQSLRALLASQGVTVHAVVLGPVDTDMNRGFEIPESAAAGIFDGLERGEDEIFPDPASQSIAEGWRNGVAKALEGQFAAFVPRSVSNAEGEPAKKTNDYTISFTVDQSPEEVFAAIDNVRGWWSEAVEGGTEKAGDVFVFQHQDIHRTTQTIVESEPGRKVVWRISDSRLSFVKNQSEWDGTEVVFEIARKGGQTELRFTHAGLVPAFECYGGCSGAWGFFVGESLHSLITTGEGKPIRKG